jgi:hypothetical protein
VFLLSVKTFKGITYTGTMGSTALAQGCDLLLHFNSKPENFKDLVQSWKESGILEEETKIYRELETAIEAFFKVHPPINRQDVPATNPRNLASQVKAILDDVDSETRWKLLNYSLSRTRYWLRKRSPRKSSIGAVASDDLDFVNQPFYTICCCLAQIEPETPFKPRDRSRPVFLEFVSEGADDIVREMVENLSGCLKTRQSNEQQRDAWKEEIYELLRYTDESNGSALLLATDGCYLKTIDLLLCQDSRLADLGTLMPAVVLSKCTEVFEKIISYREDWINTDTLREAVLARSHKILSTLLTRAKEIGRNDLVTSETAQQVVKDYGDPQLWEILKSYCNNCYKEQDCMLLHLAVKYRRKDIVTHVVKNKEGSALATTLWWDPELKVSHYPLWYNSESRGIKDQEVEVVEKKYENLAIKNGGVEQPKTEDDLKTLRKISAEIAKTCQEIRDIIVPVIIKAEKPLRIKQILDQSKGKLSVLSPFLYPVSEADIQIVTGKING